MTFADGTQVGVMGLGDIMAELYAENSAANAERLCLPAPGSPARRRRRAFAAAETLRQKSP